MSDMVGRRIIAKIKGSKDEKVLLSNFAYLSLLQVAGYVFPLLTLPYLARVIGASGFGKIAFASAIMVWIQTVADWGFNYTATRDVARCRDDKQRVSEIFSNVFWARCLLMAVSFVVLMALVFAIPKLRAEADVILVSFLMIPGHILFPDWFFQAIERMKYITILNLLSKTMFTIAVFLFVKDSDDYILQPLFVSMGFVASGCIALYFILQRWQYRLYRPRWFAVRETIQKSTNVFVNNLMPNLYNSLSYIVLGFYSTSAAVGIYDAGKKFSTIAYNLFNVVVRVFFPYLARNKEKHSTFAAISLGLALVGCGVLFVLAPWVIRLFYGADVFDGAIPVLRITTVALFFIVVNMVYGTNYLIVNGYDRGARNVTMIASLIGGISAFPLIYFYDYIGAAVTFLVSSMLLGVGAYCCYTKIRKRDA